MAAYIIGFPQEWAAERGVLRPYEEQNEALMAPYGGRYRVLGSQRVEVLEGEWKPPLGVIMLEFPTIEQARAYYDSPEYVPLRALRQAHTRSDVLLVEGQGESETLLSRLRARERRQTS